MSSFMSSRFAGDHSDGTCTGKVQDFRSRQLHNAITIRCYSKGRMNLPCDGKLLRGNELEFGAGGQRLGCKFLLDDGSLLFVNESEITSEIETLMASLGSPTEGLTQGHPATKHRA